MYLQWFWLCLTSTGLYGLNPLDFYGSVNSRKNTVFLLDFQLGRKEGVSIWTRGGDGRRSSVISRRGFSGRRDGVRCFGPLREHVTGCRARDPRGRQRFQAGHWAEVGRGHSYEWTSGSSRGPTAAGEPAAQGPAGGPHPAGRDADGFGVWQKSPSRRRITSTADHQQHRRPPISDFWYRSPQRDSPDWFCEWNRIQPQRHTFLQPSHVRSHQQN